MDENRQPGIVLLAAGASRRMGRPKQLLPVAGRPLLRIAGDVASGIGASPVVVVLGLEAGSMAAALAGLPVHVAINQDWAEGLGSSLRFGMRTALDLRPNLAAVIVLLADQPDVSPGHLQDLITAWKETGRTLIASSSGGVLQPPALFAARWFPRLLALQGDAGARGLFQDHPASVAAVPLAGAADIDTPDDYLKYVSALRKDFDARYHFP